MAQNLLMYRQKCYNEEDMKTLSPTSKLSMFNQIGMTLADRVFAASDAEPRTDTMVVFVTHSFSTSIPSIYAAEKICGKKNLLIVLKNSSEKKDFVSSLEEQGYSVSDLKKKDFRKDPAHVVSSLKAELAKRGLTKILMLDHGGYLSYHPTEFSELHVSGIVEYALNGDKKYKPLIRDGQLQTNYASIGSADSKKFPDFACGKLIGEIAATIAREVHIFGMHHRQIMQFGIIGYGRLGSKAARTLATNGAHNVMVFDLNPARMVEALQEGFNIMPESVEDIARNCNLIIVGTDTAPLRPDLYEMMRDNTTIFTVTSADDSLGLEKLIESGILTKEYDEDRVTHYRTKGGRRINLAFNGEAPNLSSAVSIDDPTLFVPFVLHGIVGYRVASGEKVHIKEMKEIESLVLAKFLDSYRDIVKAEISKIEKDTGRRL